MKTALKDPNCKCWLLPDDWPELLESFRLEIRHARRLYQIGVIWYGEYRAIHDQQVREARHDYDYMKRHGFKIPKLGER